MALCKLDKNKFLGTTLTYINMLESHGLIDIQKGYWLYKYLKKQNLRAMLS